MIRVWNVKDLECKSDVEILRECCRKVYLTCRDLLSKYGDGVGVRCSIFDMEHLGGVEDLLFSLCGVLFDIVTYREHLVLLDECLCGFRCGGEFGSVPVFVDSVFNGTAFDSYFVDFRDEYLSHCGSGDVLSWCLEFVIGFFKRVVNVCVKVLRENDVGDIF